MKLRILMFFIVPLSLLASELKTTTKTSPYVDNEGDEIVVLDFKADEKTNEKPDQKATKTTILRPSSIFDEEIILNENASETIENLSPK